MSCKHTLPFAWHHDSGLVCNKELTGGPLVSGMNSFQAGPGEVSYVLLDTWRIFLPRPLLTAHP